MSLDQDTGLLAGTSDGAGAGAGLGAGTGSGAGAAGSAGADTGVRVVVLQAHRMRLRPASREDTEWLRDLLDRAGRDLGLGTRLASRPDGTLALRTA